MRLRKIRDVLRLACSERGTQRAAYHIQFCWHRYLSRYAQKNDVLYTAIMHPNHIANLHSANYSAVAPVPALLPPPSTGKSHPPAPPAPPGHPSASASQLSQLHARLARLESASDRQRVAYDALLRDSSDIKSAIAMMRDELGRVPANASPSRVPSMPPDGNLSNTITSSPYES